MTQNKGQEKRGKVTDVFKATKECPYPMRGVFKKNGKLYERVVDSHMVRDILIPDRSGNVQTTYFCSDDYYNIKNYANEVPPNREEVYIQLKKEQARLIEESSNRVKELRLIDLQRASGKQDSRGDLAAEDKAKADYSQKRAKELLMNQKDEMKMCNKFIIEAKCQQIRKDQIAEKELIMEEEKNVARQHNEVMIQKMLDDAVNYEKEKDKEHLKKKRYVEGINSQIKENELRRQIEAEQLAEEGRLNREAACQEMRMALEVRNKKFTQVQEGLKKLNDYNKNVIKYMRAVENEETRMEEQRIKNFIEEKERKEREAERERLRLKAEKDEILNKLSEQKQKSQDDEAMREEIHTQYVQDLVERKWRQKEREEMEKKARQKKEISDGREKQRQLKEEMTAAETLAEKEDFYQRLRVLEQQLDKEKQQEIMRKETAYKHRKELMNQIHTREAEAIEERKNKFSEALTMAEARKAELIEIKEHVEIKMHTLREFNLPVNCEMEIRRKLAREKIL